VTLLWLQIHEKFDTGTQYGLKELISVKNVSRTMHFYPSARLDGLLIRDEVRPRSPGEGNALSRTFPFLEVSRRLQNIVRLSKVRSFCQKCE
jgi:hypothetical protein